MEWRPCHSGFEVTILNIIPVCGYLHFRSVFLLVILILFVCNAGVCWCQGCWLHFVITFHCMVTIVTAVVGNGNFLLSLSGIIAVFVLSLDSWLLLLDICQGGSSGPSFGPSADTHDKTHVRIELSVPSQFILGVDVNRILSTSSTSSKPASRTSMLVSRRLRSRKARSIASSKIPT